MNRPSIRYLTIRALQIFLCCGLASAQQTRKEIPNPSRNPADDAKPNNPEVPDVYAIKGQFDRIEIWRFKYGTDLLAGMQKMAKQNRIKNAVILSAVGSIRGYHLHQITNRDFPSKNTYVKDPTGPADMIGMNGYVIAGKVHAHATFATPEHAFGGHVEPGTEVFTFAIVTIGVLNDAADLSRVDDKTYR